MRMILDRYDLEHKKSLNEVVLNQISALLERAAPSDPFRKFEVVIKARRLE